MLKLSVISLFATDTTLEIRSSAACSEQTPRFNHSDIFNGPLLWEKDELQGCTVVFKSRCSPFVFRKCVAYLYVCTLVFHESTWDPFVSFQCCRKRKRWIHYHLVKYKCRYVVQQRNSNVSWKIYCFCHKILMQDFTKTFRQVVSINETNKQTSIQCMGNTSQQTDLSANMGQSVWRLHKNINIRYLK